MCFKFIFAKKCPNCNIEMIAEEVDDIGVLCGRQGTEYYCPECHHTDFEGIMA